MNPTAVEPPDNDGVPDDLSLDELRGAKTQPKEISIAYLQMAFERSYKGDVGKRPSSLDALRYSQFDKRKNGTYQNDRLQNIFQGFCLALQSINNSSIAFSDIKNGNL